MVLHRKLSTEILAIYTDYISEFTEDYTTINGIPVSALNEIPNGLIRREFDAVYFSLPNSQGYQYQTILRYPPKTGKTSVYYFNCLSGYANSIGQLICTFKLFIRLFK